jgi:hypothetical protein
MHLRRSLGLAVLVSGIIGGSLLPQAQAAGMKTYTNKAYGYSMQYPANWTLKLHTSQADAMFTAPDTNAIVTSSGNRGTATIAAIKAQQAKVLKGLGKAQGSLTYKRVLINGVIYELSEIVTKVKSGKVLDSVLLDTVHAGNIYDFEAFVLFNASSTKGETKAVQHMLNSILLKK